MSGNATHLPQITSADIEWAAQLLGLPKHAFHGSSVDDTRRQVLESQSSIDVEACPGSGKTTLLVAKLAIVSRYWHSRRQGLCVLSHTNVARKEIEEKLGGFAAGRQLLKFPHFIGTIHAFFNEFVAVPWLRSQGIIVEVVDDAITLNKRWYRIPHSQRVALSRNRHTESVLRVRDVEFDLGDIHWGKGKLSKESATYQELQKACRETHQAGYFCHDEMLLWAQQAMDQSQQLRLGLRSRFPVVFIDEAQDTNSLQLKLIESFTRDGQTIQQRFGDSNQAIFDYEDRDESTSRQSFPREERKVHVRDSNRFGPEIASLADPLAIAPQHLIGRRSRRTKSSVGDSLCTIFLFDDSNIHNVLQNYAMYLTSIFDDKELVDGSFFAVGAIHRETAKAKCPKSVAEYFDRYESESSRKTRKLTNYSAFVSDSLFVSLETGESHKIVNGFAHCILHLARRLNPRLRCFEQNRSHRFVVGELESEPTVYAEYREFVRGLATRGNGLSEGEWNTRFKPLLLKCARTISGEVSHFESDALLKWDAADSSSKTEVRADRSPNTFYYPVEHPKVSIQIASIHSVKGQTHTATLVMDTFRLTHHLKQLKRWILGKCSGGGSSNAAMQRRLRLHYVAMTRASELLCLAMRKDVFTSRELESLKKRWRVAFVSESGPIWL